MVNGVLPNLKDSEGGIPQDPNFFGYGFGIRQRGQMAE